MKIVYNVAKRQANLIKSHHLQSNLHTHYSGHVTCFEMYLVGNYSEHSYSGHSILH